ncbi:13111_t:CDS:1 [Cetraspora pellucida]|uniref:13111_t:CDS:1 n=1 Tax=Cetraspora pellucida TaxID=1433469 RepID=A0A9N9J6A5_9GLOM|nr:13111_t:CDS:1 [Cetraspora pellucida]
MPQQKVRNHTTVACIRCRRKRKKCNVLSGESKCTNCNELNQPCIFIPGNKRGRKSTDKARQNALITNHFPPSIHDERMSNDAQNITSFPNSFSANHTTATNINPYKTTEAIKTTENFQNIQPSSNFHDQIIPNNDQNMPSFSTNDSNGSFYHEIPHPYINPYDEATEAPQNCKFVAICLNHFRQSDCVHSFLSRLAD